MASSEVQVFDGDGVVTPEIKALIAENERLRRELEATQETLARTERDISKMYNENDFLLKKLSMIEHALNLPYKNEKLDYGGDDLGDGYDIPMTGPSTHDNFRTGYNHNA